MLNVAPVLSLALLMGALSLPLRGFEKIIIDGLEPSSVSTLDPLTLEAGDFIDDVYTRLFWIEDEGVYKKLYNSTEGWPLGGMSDSLEVFDLGTKDGVLYVVSTLTTEAGRKGEGAVGVYRNGALHEYAPRAREALGDGATSRFSYNFPRVGGDGLVAMAGFDSIFPHFVLLASEGQVDIIAQESVTLRPESTSPFERFSPLTNLSPDGNQLVFRGRSVDGVEGIFRWTAAGGIVTLALADDLSPATSEPYGTFMDSSKEAYFSPDGQLFILDVGAGIMLAYRDGAFQSFVKTGDMILGEEIQSVQRVEFTSSGDLLVHDANGQRLLRYADDQWSLFQRLGVDVGDLDFLLHQFWAERDGVYFLSSKFDEVTRTNQISVHRLDDQGSDLERVYIADPAIFGERFTIRELYRLEDGVLIQTTDGIYRGDFSIEGGNGGNGGSGDDLPKTLTAYLDLLPEGARDPVLDGDGDGIANAIEFLLGMDANAVDAWREAFQLDLMAGDALGLVGDDRIYVSVRLRVRTGLSGVTYAPRLSTDLQTLASGAEQLVTVGEPTTEGDFTVIHYRSTFSIDAAASAFVDLEVTVSAE